MNEPNDPKDRQTRLQLIRTLITTESIASQEVLAHRLREEGHAATQSSVSRDLAVLRVAKQGGVYRLPDQKAKAEVGRGFSGLEGLITAVDAAGPHLVVIHTKIGAASQCGLLLDRSNVVEIVGTIAGDDTVFCACMDADAQRRLRQKLAKILSGK